MGRNFARLLITAGLSALLFFPSCRSLLDVTDNVERSFSAPGKIPDKIRNPVGDSVNLSVLWIGHASVLIQMHDKVIITDPLFTNNVAQVLRRFKEPGLDLKDLQKLDLILLSHSHMDHFDLPSLGDLSEKFPGTELLFPEGVEKYLPDYDLDFVRFRMWDGKSKYYTGETKTIGGMEITSVASVHWGGRYGLDGKLFTNAGFCGYIIRYKGLTVYFTSDTAYDDKLFRYLGEKYKIDLAVVPLIYCNDCADINQRGSHIFPRGILKILDDTRAKYIVPTHYGTFTDPEKQYPVLSRMLHTTEDYKSRVIILKLGEQAVIEKRTRED